MAIIPITKENLCRERFSPLDVWIAPEAVALEERGRTYRKLLDCQNEEVIERVYGPVPPTLDESSELRELRIRLNPQAATEGDVVFLLQRLDEALASAMPDSNCASAPAVDVAAWIAANQRPPEGPDWTAVLDKPYFPPV